jgi:hypothetical protein
VIELPIGRPERTPEIFGLTFSAIKLSDKTRNTTVIAFIIMSSIIHPLFKR